MPTIRKRVVFWIVGWLTIVCHLNGLAQIDKLKQQVKVATKDSVLARNKESTFQFKNINKVRYYLDEKKLKQIFKLIKAQDYKKAYPMLYEYVMNFGVENFYKDTDLIWRLAKMMESLEDFELSKSLYRLVLKHHRGGDVRNLELYYDSLTRNDKDYYVPLQFYYELVEYRKLIDTLIPPQGVLLKVDDLPNYIGPGIKDSTINSTLDDYGPTLSINDDILLFTSKRNEKDVIDARKSRLSNEDIFYSKRLGRDDGGSYWGEAKEFKGLNTSYNEGSAHITKDGKSILFARCEAPDGYGNCDLYVAYIQGDSSWKAVNLGSNINSVGWDSHPSLSPNEDTLFFASDRIGGFGMSDIYYSVKQSNGSWGPAQNIGPVVNTRKSEVSPFRHPKYNILYFSSDGHIVNFRDSQDSSIRSFDIYKAYYFYDRWQEPKNIGPLVNEGKDEYYFTIDSKAQDLFYAKTDQQEAFLKISGRSNRNIRTKDNRDSTVTTESLDLFSFPVPMEAQPTATVLFRGSLTDSTGNPFQGIVAIVDLDNGIEVAPKFLRPDGSYEFDLIKDNNYLLIITGEDFFRIEKKFFLTGDTTLNLQTPSLKFSKWKFASLEFKAGSSDILSEMESDLQKVVYFLIDHPTLRLKISGHTDSSGDPASNLKLSQDRANSIKKHLINKGKINPARVEAMGYGSSKPIVTEVTEKDKQLNRRVEFEIIR